MNSKKKSRSIFCSEQKNCNCRDLDVLHVYAREGDVNGLLARIESGFSVNMIGTGFSDFNSPFIRLTSF